MLVAITLLSSISRLCKAYSAALICRDAAVWFAMISVTRDRDSSTIEVARCQCVSLERTLGRSIFRPGGLFATRKQNAEFHAVPNREWMIANESLLIWMCIDSLPELGRCRNC